jgi:hypothetical protein
MYKGEPLETLKFWHIAVFYLTMHGLRAGQILRD